VSPRTNARHLSILAERGPLLDVLDWGCGTAEYRPLVTDVLRDRYVGVDRDGRDADVLTDVHVLPFRDASFDHVITNAVLEHTANPFVAVREVARVLKPGGVFSGSVAFMEPYHHRSYFHPSPDGVAHVMGTAGLDLEGLWPQETWTVFQSLADMPGPISGPTRLVLRWLGRWERLVRRRQLHPREMRAGRWMRRRTAEELAAELLTITGQVDFLARRP
jgi:SAM-dependent methyltransferase